MDYIIQENTGLVHSRGGWTTTTRYKMGHSPGTQNPTAINSPVVTGEVDLELDKSGSTCNKELVSNTWKAWNLNVKGSCRSMKNDEQWRKKQRCKSMLGNKKWPHADILKQHEHNFLPSKELTNCAVTNHCNTLSTTRMTPLTLYPRRVGEEKTE